MARLHREGMRWVLDRVLAGEFSEGAMLPREVDLAVQLGVSRGVAREMIRALEERRVVSVRHGRGARVAAFEEWDVLDGEVLGALLASSRARSTLAELIECRRLLEVDAAGLAAARATAGELDELRAAMRAVETAPARDGVARGLAEVAFHRALLRAARNRPLWTLLSPVLDATAQFAAMLGRRRSGVAELEAIVAAVEARDGDRAADAMRAHLDALGRYLQRARVEVHAT